MSISKDNLKRWKKEYKEGKFNLLAGAIQKTSKEAEELARLKKELYEVKLERDILKKAVSIFSKSDR